MVRVIEKHSLLRLIRSSLTLHRMVQLPQLPSWTHCPDCFRSPHDTGNLFNYHNTPTLLSSVDLCSRPKWHKFSRFQSYRMVYKIIINYIFIFTKEFLALEALTIQVIYLTIIIRQFSWSLLKTEMAQKFSKFQSYKIIINVIFIFTK